MSIEIIVLIEDIEEMVNTASQHGKTTITFTLSEGRQLLDILRSIRHG